MSDMKAYVTEVETGFNVCGYEKIEYDFEFLDGVFDPANAQLANCYQPWGRCLAVMDLNIFTIYGAMVQKYFAQYDIDLKIHKTMIGEKAKSMDTLLSIVDSMNEFGIYRKEPVLVVGGGLVTDVAGYVQDEKRVCERCLNILITGTDLRVLLIAAILIIFAFQLPSLASSTHPFPSKLLSTMDATRIAWVLTMLRFTRFSTSPFYARCR